MKMYIWRYIEQVTDNYHDGGGVMIYTSRNPNDVWTEYLKTLEEVPHYDVEDVRKSLPEADVIIEGGADTEEQVFVFQDAGCC